MTEFEEITLKKIIKNKMVEDFYVNLNVLLGVSGTSADPAYAGQMHECIRECLREMYKDKADEIPLMYGGSVNSENAPGLLAQLQIDGLGIGRSAWNAAEFDAIMRCACTGSK